MKKQHIFFDLDGTLTDSMPGITRAVQYALKHYGIIEEDLKKLTPFVGPPLHESFMEYYDFPVEKAKEAVHVFREYYNVTGWKENAPYDGVEELLKGLLEDGRILYVATSKPEAMAKRVLEHFSMTKYFTFIGGAVDDGTREKKDEVIRFVMEENGLSDRESILMVGDRSHDMAGAGKVGIDALGVLYGYGSREELLGAGARWLAATPADCLACIKNI